MAFYHSGETANDRSIVMEAFQKKLVKLIGKCSFFPPFLLLPLFFPVATPSFLKDSNTKCDVLIVKGTEFPQQDNEHSTTLTFEVGSLMAQRTSKRMIIITRNPDVKSIENLQKLYR